MSTDVNKAIVVRIASVEIGPMYDLPPPADVAARFDQMPKPARNVLWRIRRLIFAVADTTKGAGQIQETLKWGQPSYLTVNPKSGTTIRLGLTMDMRPAIFTHCQTTVIADFRHVYGDNFTYDGNRAVILSKDMPDELPLRQLIHRAVTYHLNKNAAQN